LAQVGDVRAVSLEGDEGLEGADLHVPVGGELVERALALRVAGRRGPAVEEAARARRVLGEVDLTGPRVDRGGLVGEPAEELQRDRRRVDVGPLALRVDLEDVPVVLLEAVAPGALLGLLAGQPRAPGRDAAGAVVDGA